MKWSVAVGALLGGAIGLLVTARRIVHELATDPTAPGGRLAGMEKNFPGNDPYVAGEVFWSSTPIILLTVLAGAVAAALLFTVTKRLLKK